MSETITFEDFSKIDLRVGTIIEVKSPKDLPDENQIKAFLEPIAEINIITPADYLGPIIELCIKKRASQTNLQYRTNSVEISFEIPLSEIIQSRCAGVSEMEILRILFSALGANPCQMAFSI